MRRSSPFMLQNLQGNFPETSKLSTSTEETHTEPIINVSIAQEVIRSIKLLLEMEKQIKEEDRINSVIYKYDQEDINRRN